MKKSASFLLLSAALLVPAVCVWIVGFLGIGMGIESAVKLLKGFNSMSPTMHILIEGVLPLFSIGLSLVALLEKKRNHNAAVILLIVGALLVAAFGLGYTYSL